MKKKIIEILTEANPELVKSIKSPQDLTDAINANKSRIDRAQNNGEYNQEKLNQAILEGLKEKDTSATADAPEFSADLMENRRQLIAALADAPAAQTKTDRTEKPAPKADKAPEKKAEKTDAE